MADLLIRNLDEAVIERLERQAQARKIPLEQFLREILTAAAGPSRQQILAAMDRIRRMTPKRLTDDSTDMIRADRDSR